MTSAPCLALSPPDPPGGARAHLVGIGGIGMSALARLLHAAGHEVSGSDSREGETTRGLADLGVRISIGHRGDNLGAAELVIRSEAIPEDNAELVEAARRGLPVLRRARALGELLRGRRAVGIAGTHGKTTTSAMVVHILEAAGREPTWAVGGLLAPDGLNARLGRGTLFVYEACEGYGSLDDVRADVACVTSIDDDHVDHFGSLRRLESSFVGYLARLPAGGSALLCGDDPGVGRILTEVDPPRRVLYGLSADCDLRGTDVVPAGASTRFRLVDGGRVRGRCALPVPGLHNVRNALGALAVAREAGVPLEVGLRALEGFASVRRRFEVVGRAAGRTVVDDYAHHPSEVAASLEAARQLLGASAGRVVVLFQPHLYSRTQALHSRLAESLAPADAVVVLGVYGAREAPIEGVGSRLVVDALEAAGHRSCRSVEGGEEALRLAIALSRPGDLVVTMGAGDVTRLARRLVEMLVSTDPSRICGEGHAPSTPRSV